MIDSKDYIVISDRNWRQYAGTLDGFTPVVGGIQPYHSLAPMLQGNTGYLGWEKPGETHGYRGVMPVTDVIPRSQWAGMIRAGAGTKALNALNGAGVKAKNQNGLSYCWIYGATRVVEARRLVEGLSHVELCPESAGGPATGWRNQGGYAEEAFSQIQKGGLCEMSYQDAPCSLHSNKWKQGWQDNAMQHQAVNWINIDGSYSAPMFDQVMTALIRESPVAAGLGWWGHLVAFLAPVLFSDGSFGVLFQNSWTPDWPTQGANSYAILTESRATPDGAATCELTNDFAVEG